MSSIVTIIKDTNGRDVPEQFIMDSGKVSRTISAHELKQTDVVAELVSAVKKGDIKLACVYSCEMIVSGWYNMYKSVVIDYIIKYFNVHALPDFLQYVLDKFKYLDSIKAKHKIRIIDIHQNQEIRNFVCFLVTMLCIIPRYQLKLEQPDVLDRDIDIGKDLRALATKCVESVSTIGSKRDVRHFSVTFGYFVHHVLSGKLAKATNLVFEPTESVKIGRCSHFTTSKKTEDSPIWLFWAFLFSRLGECPRPRCHDVFDILQKLFNTALDRGKENMAKYILYTMLLYMYGPKPAAVIDVSKLLSNNKVLCIGLSSNMLFARLERDIKVIKRKL
jgi:hypothetical protein